MERGHTPKGGTRKQRSSQTGCHDGIGNRDWTFAGSAAGKTQYASNAKNQLSSVTNPGVAHVSGYAPAGSRVEVSYAGSTWAAHRDGAYWYAAVAVDNAGSAVAAVITVTITDPDGAYTVRTITRLVHKASEYLLVNGTGELKVDLRGSRTSDSVWDYEWDDLDRLKSVTIKTALRDAWNVRVEFAYDFFGRRIGKTVKEWDSQAGQWVTAEGGVTKFIWSGWLLLAETNGENKITRSYVWGRDISGSVGGAGGIGGLLAVQHHNTSGAVEHTYWVGADERGDTKRLVEASAGQRKVVAAFEYGPHGELLAVDAEPGYGVSDATPTALCPFLHSTKYYDQETGLYYFGYRYMDPATGTWLNRDPIGEQGGLNLYRYYWPDPLGLEGYIHWKEEDQGTLRHGQQVTLIAHSEYLWGAWKSDKVIATGQYLAFASKVPGYTEKYLQYKGKYYYWGLEECINLSRRNGFSTQDFEAFLAKCATIDVSGKETADDRITRIYKRAAEQGEFDASDDAWVKGLKGEGSEIVEFYKRAFDSLYDYLESNIKYAPDRKEALIYSAQRKLYPKASEERPKPRPVLAYSTVRESPQADGGGLFAWCKPAEDYYLGRARGRAYGTTWYDPGGEKDYVTTANWTWLSAGGVIGKLFVRQSCAAQMGGEGRATYLYRLEHRSGDFLKWGISYDPYTRYPGALMKDCRVIPMISGERRAMLNIERYLVEVNPGPINMEPWAGTRWTPGLVPAP